MTPVTVKKLNTNMNPVKNLKEEFDEEVALVSRLDHPNIVKLLAITTKEDPYCMIFEFMKLGPLHIFLRKGKPLDEAEKTQGV